MIRFLFKGLLRDKSRSRLPVIVVALGVMLSVFMHSYITGLMSDMIEMTAKFTTGHLKVMTKAYADNADQFPNDLAMLDAGKMKEKLATDFPGFQWTPRINFGGLIDVPDTTGETRSQGPAMGLGIDLLSEGSEEAERLNLAKSLVNGRLPEKRGEILLSDAFSKKLQVKPGEQVTLIGSTMNGGMAISNFTVAGTVRFGTNALDRGTLIADIADVQQALEMTDAASEILGFSKEGYYDNDEEELIARQFNSKYNTSEDLYKPVMQKLGDQRGMDTYIFMSESMGSIITFVFIIAMSLVLWNAGLLGALRRYGEIGVRLAMGEEKGHVYRMMIYESVMIGIAGTIIGTCFGLGFAWLMQTYGLHIETFTKGATAAVMMPDVVRARITVTDYYIGFIPGVISTIIGTSLAGIGIFKRKTAQLFKELEA
ncbi:MAG TPA: FtsX-like permease family protein [Bacteroidales bacterium]|nr:FtsX-like permease family protein [Bacteroidales bacterium]